MDETELTKLESKIYIFSVDVFSFTKTLLNQNITNSYTTGLLKTSNQLYSTFLDLVDNHINENKQVIHSNCIQLANNCAEFLNNIEVKGSLLNERVDLLIEAKELTRILEKLELKWD